MTEETIFLTALEKPTPVERAAYLEAACAGDPALRRRVEALLRAHEQSGDLLDPPVHAPGPRTEHAPGAAPPGAGAGRPIAEAAGILGLSTSTADRYGAHPRAWLRVEIAGRDAPGPSSGP